MGANVEEATAGISKKEFAAKMSIVSKEARETKYWLLLLKESDLVQIRVDHLIDHSEELIRISLRS
ncbi:MAG: four helix bundle protein [Bacteroidota bacterium]